MLSPSSTVKPRLRNRVFRSFLSLVYKAFRVSRSLAPSVYGGGYGYGKMKGRFNVLLSIGLSRRFISPLKRAEKSSCIADHAVNGRGYMPPSAESPLKRAGNHKSPTRLMRIRVQLTITTPHADVAIRPRGRGKPCTTRLKTHLKILLRAVLKILVTLLSLKPIRFQRRDRRDRGDLLTLKHAYFNQKQKNKTLLPLRPQRSLR